MNATELKKKINGVLVAPATPFKNDLELDGDGIESNIDTLVKEGGSTVFPCGTMGEIPALSDEEWLTVVRLNVGAVGGRVPVLATVATPSVRATLKRIEEAATAEADGVVIVAPYYHKVSPAEAVEFYRQVDGCGVPFLAYNSPSSGGPPIRENELELLRTLPNFLGLKEGTGDVMEYVRKRRMLGNDHLLLAAAENPLLFMLVAGTDGCLTATASFAPQFTAKIWGAAVDNDFAKARELYFDLLAFRKIVGAASAGGRPGFVTVLKAALDIRGLRGGPTRPPLTDTMDDEQRQQLEIVMRTKLGMDF